jgi:hypothetical protein
MTYLAGRATTVLDYQLPWMISPKNTLLHCMLCGWSFQSAIAITVSISHVERYTNQTIQRRPPSLRDRLPLD